MFAQNTEYSFHAFANFFPMMSDDEFASLVEDVKRSGLREKIWLFQGQILDGRNRYLACLKAEAMPQFRDFPGSEEDALKAVSSWNLERRHLTTSQRAMIAVQGILPALEAIARQKQIEAGKAKTLAQGNETRKLPANSPEAPKRVLSESREIAAQQMKVGSNSIQKAKTIAQKAPELAKQVTQGKITLHKAVRQIKTQEQQEQAVRLDNIQSLEVKESIAVQLGDTWALGDHVLYCGDSSQWRPDITAKMAFADPPYGGKVDEWDQQFYWQHDWLESIADYVFVTPGIANHQQFFKLTEMRYRWTYFHWLSNAIARHNDWGYSNMINAILFSKLKSLSLAGGCDFRQAIVNQELNSATAHKGRKPHSLLSWLIDMTTNETDIVIDPFLGSGTTLLVAEDMGRVCYGAELNPLYCSDIVSRWQRQTQNKTAPKRIQTA